MAGDEAGGPPGRLPGGRKRNAAIEAGEHVRPYDSPLLGGTLARGAGGPQAGGKLPPAAVTAHAVGDDEPLPDALLFGPPTVPPGAGPQAGQRTHPGMTPGPARIRPLLAAALTRPLPRLPGSRRDQR